MSLYHSVHIGNLKVPGNLFLAPVAGYSDRAFRFICKENGADMGYTEMVSSEAIYRGSDKSEKLLLKAQNDPLFAVQIFGGNETAIFEGSSFIIKKYLPHCLTYVHGYSYMYLRFHMDGLEGTNLPTDPATLAVVKIKSKALAV